MSSRVAIIGGGITGLTAAYRLSRLLPESDVFLIDERPQFGGKIVTERGGRFVIEGAPDCFLSRKPQGIALCEELGIADRLIGKRPENSATFVRVDGKLHPLPEGLSGMVPTDFEALRSSTLLSDSGRKRLEDEPSIEPFAGDTDESIADFMIRRLGIEAYERIIEPLLGGINGGDGRILSLAAAFPQLREIERKHGSLIEGLQKEPVPDSDYPAFVSFPGGMIEMVEALESKLPNVHRLRGARVSSLTRSGRSYRLDISDGNTVDADAVIITTPGFVTADLVENIDSDLAAAHRTIPYGSSATISLAYESRLEVPASYGYLVPLIEKADVLACTITSNKFEHRAPVDHTLVRVYLSNRLRDDIISEGDDFMVQLAREELASTLGVDAAPDHQWVYRWEKGMPQYTIGHIDRVSDIERHVDCIDGLFVAGATYRGVGIPDCIESAERGATACATWLENTGLKQRTLPQ